MSSKIGPDPRLPVRPQSALSQAADVIIDATKDIKAIAVAEGAAVVANLADFVGSAAEASDLGATALEGGARTLESGRLNRITRLGINAGKLEQLAGHLGKVAVTAGALQAGLKSDNSTTGGKIAEGAAVGAGTVALTTIASGLKAGNPIMLADMAANVAGESVLGKETNQKFGGYISGHVISTPAKIITAWSDALLNGDDTALNKFAEAAQAGEYGVVYKGALEAGQILSDKLDIPSAIEAVVNAPQTAKAAVANAKAAVKTASAAVTAKATELVNKGVTGLTADAQRGQYGTAVKTALQVGQVVSDKLNVAGGIEAAVNAASVVSAAWSRGVSFLSGR